jgi:hypothetical protein
MIVVPFQSKSRDAIARRASARALHWLHGRPHRNP